MVNISSTFALEFRYANFVRFFFIITSGNEGRILNSLFFLFHPLRDAAASIDVNIVSNGNLYAEKRISESSVNL